MKLCVVSVGKPKAEWAQAAVEEYRRRLSRALAPVWQTVAEERSGDASRCRAVETERLQRALGPRDCAVLLDERGKTRTSVDFASWLYERLERASGRLVFLIGGSWGVEDSLRERATEMLSLTPMTLTHEMCLVLLFEQLYRASTIRIGSGYHH